MQHQKDAVEFFLKNNGVAAFHHEVGTGKTLSALACYEAAKEKEPNLKLLVICPISLIHGAWIKEIEKFTNYMWMDLHAGKSNKQVVRFPIVFPEVYIINFDALISKSRFDILKSLLQSSDSEWMVVIDEASKMKNHSTATAERLNGWWEKKKYTTGIREICKYRLELTGTPAPNSETEYWSQMYFLHPHILGDNFFQFRNYYFQLGRGKEIVPGAVYSRSAMAELLSTGYKYTFNEARRQEFFDRLKPWCHVVKAKDCLDLPPHVDEYRIIDMTEKQQKVYKQMKIDYIAEIQNDIENYKLTGIVIDGVKQEGPATPSDIYNEMRQAKQPSSFIVANIVLTKMMKLRQITSGFAIDDQENSIPVDSKNPKLQELLSIVEECGNEQMIIWCQFKHEVKIVVEALSKIAVVAQLHGGIPQGDRIGNQDAFLNGHARFLVCHPKTVAHGLTFVNCNIMVFFSLDYSFENYSQCRGRIMRKGQERNCVYFHLLMRGTIDEDMLAVCQKKKEKQVIAEEFMRS